MTYQPVKGTHDIYGLEAEGMRYIEAVLSAAAELYGYHEMIIPIFEYTEVFSRGTGAGSDVVRKEMYTFLDKGNRSVTLRPEFTAGIVRSIISNKLYAEDLPLKYYYTGPAFRYERPQLGRYRQFHQFGVENIGQDDAKVDAETILLAVQALKMLGFEKLSLKINSIGDEESRLAYKKALVSYFEQHIDQMCEDCHERLLINPLRMLDCKVTSDQEIVKDAPKIKDYLSINSKKRFYETLSVLNDFGIEYEKDEGLVRGLDYYSEVVFEIHAISPEGHDYGAICGGGHYGGLLKELGGPDYAGVGFAMGEERIYALMNELKLLKDIECGIDLFVMPIGEETFEEAFNITMQARALGYSAETSLQSGKLASFFKKAERRHAKFALIIGEDEIKKGVAQLKDLNKKEQREISLTNLEEELDKVFGEDEHHHEED